MFLIQTGQDRIPPAILQQGFTVQGPSNAATNAAMGQWYDPSQQGDATPRFKLGSYWQDDATGNYFQYVKAAAALYVGQLVTFPVPGTDTVSATSSTLDTVTLVTGGLTAGAETNNYFFAIGAAAGGTSGTGSLFVQALRLIKANTASVITVSQKGSIYGNNVFDPDTLNAAPTNATNVSIIRPYQVIVGTASSVPVGVAVGTAAINTFTMIQLNGLALVQAVGNTTALVVNQIAVPGATGTITGPTAGQLFFVGAASIVPQVAWAGAATTLIPCYVNFSGV